MSRNPEALAELRRAVRRYLRATATEAPPIDAGRLILRAAARTYTETPCFGGTQPGAHFTRAAGELDQAAITYTLAVLAHGSEPTDRVLN